MVKILEVAKVVKYFELSKSRANKIAIYVSFA